MGNHGLSVFGKDIKMGKTINEVFESLTEEQKEAVYIMIAVSQKEAIKETKRRTLDFINFGGPQEAIEFLTRED